MRHPLGMAHRVRDRDRAPLGDPEQREPRDLRAIYGDPANLDLWVKEMKKVTPRTKIVTLPYFGSFAP